MFVSRNDKLTAISGKTLVTLDLGRNRYTVSELKGAQERAIEAQPVSNLRDNLFPPRSVIPPIALLKSYRNFSKIAKNISARPIIDQLEVLDALVTVVQRSAAEEQSVRELSSYYQYIRSFRIRRPLCLEDSVCGYLFFRNYFDDVSLHIGVRNPPFKAHAWLQSGDIILNDNEAIVGSFSVILRYAK